MPRRCAWFGGKGRVVRARRSGLAAEGKEEKERAALLLLLEEGCPRWKKGDAVLLLLLLLVLKVLLVLVQAREKRKKLAAEQAALGEEVVARCRRVEEVESMMMLPFTRGCLAQYSSHQAVHCRAGCLWRMAW